MSTDNESESLSSLPGSGDACCADEKCSASRCRVVSCWVIWIFAVLLEIAAISVIIFDDNDKLTVTIVAICFGCLISAPLCVWAATLCSPPPV